MKKFQRTREDFTCEHCGTFAEGDGYTDHCPICLWGKHVDVFPGDRAETCQGMLEPRAIFLEHGEEHIRYRCQTCGAEKHNKISKKRFT